jgi:hypothetical protein
MNASNIEKACTWVMFLTSLGHRTFFSPGPGYYCGMSIGKQADHLYYCENGIWTDKEACQYGCFANKPGT